MKLLFRSSFFALLLTFPVIASALESDLEKLSYSLGVILGERIQNDFGELDPHFVLQGLQDAGNPSDWKMDRAAINSAIQNAQARIRAEQEKQVKAMSERNLEAGEAFLVENAKKEGVIVTDSGLQYKVISEGTGPQPIASDTVEVHYEGRLISGDIFDSSIARGEPVSFPLNGVIPGWSEGVQLMRVGSKFQFSIPAQLAYGSSGTGPIPPNSVLIFEVELLQINPEN